MIQDIYPKILKNQFSEKKAPQKEDFVLIFQNSKILSKLDENQQVIFPKILNFNASLNFIYLFSIDEKSYFLLQDYTDTLEGFDFIEIRELRKKTAGPKFQMMAAYTGKHLADWYRDMKFCGRCGKEMVHSVSERAMVCNCCNYTAYPRIMPAVIVGVINGDKILLTKYRTGYQNYALVAGFTEIGETAEETVAREVMEETGLRIKNLRYYKSQPWGIANDLLLGFYCEVDGSTEIYMDDNELKFAEWVSREEVVLQPDEFSLTNEMMKLFKEGLIR